jgi:hypothetical protein
LTQIHDQQMADLRPGGAGRPPVAVPAVTPIQTSLGTAPQFNMVAGATSQPAAGASQASWQPPARPSSSGLPLTNGDATFETPPSQSSMNAAQRPGAPAGGNDPWANFSP